MNELKSILDESRISPRIDTSIFPSTVEGRYWTSQTYLAAISNSWNVLFNDGTVSSYGKANTINVRCVTGP